MPRRPVDKRDPWPLYERTGWTPRYCAGCHHAQWHHRGLYPKKTYCAVLGCICGLYLTVHDVPPPRRQ